MRWFSEEDASYTTPREELIAVIEPFYLTKEWKTLFMNVR